MGRLTKPLPPEAKLVFKGQIFEVWQWEQKMYDGSTRIFERLKRPNTVEIIAVVNDKILVQYQEQPDSLPFICVPGGRVEEGEEPLLGAQRELLEETGYSSSDWQLLSEDQPSGKMEWMLYNYIARNCKKVQDPALDAGEKIRNELITFEEFLLLADNPDFRSTGIRAELWRARVDNEKKDELYKRLFST